MSRRHDAKAVGNGFVTLVCDVCNKTEPYLVEFDDEDPCLVDLAIQKYEWMYADDAIVCSDKCSQEFWSF